MGATTHPQLANRERVQLALESRFNVGSLEVDPSTRQVRSNERHETLEPRIMQVLVVLARAGARVVSRDELVECCWENRAVSEDAINRALSRLRQIASDIGRNTFRIETIRGVGYRLIEEGRTESPTGALYLRGSLSRRTIFVGSAAAAAALAAGIGVVLLPRAKHQPSPLAMQLYRRGMETRGQADPELYEQGTALFRQATRVDPQWADAWGALAWNYQGLLQFGPRSDSDRLRALCRSAAAHALALDADNADAQAALLLLKPFYRNWAAIEQGCRDLLRRHPHHSILEHNLAYDLIQVGRWREAVPLFRAVVTREPFWPLSRLLLVGALFESGNVEEADDLIEDGIKRFPRRVDYWVCKVRHLIAAGRLSEAIAFIDNLNSRPAVSIDPAIEFEIEIVHALAEGSESVRRAALNRMLTTVRSVPAYAAQAAVGACVLGQMDTSISLFDGLYFGRGEWANAQDNRASTDMLFISSTASLRAHPHFPTLLRETGLAEYWKVSRSLPDYRRFA